MTPSAEHLNNPPPSSKHIWLPQCVHSSDRCHFQSSQGCKNEHKALYYQLYTAQRNQMMKSFDIDPESPKKRNSVPQRKRQLRKLLFYAASSRHQSTEVCNHCLAAHALVNVGGETQVGDNLSFPELRFAIRILIDKKRNSIRQKTKQFSLVLQTSFQHHNQYFSTLLDQTYQVSA